MTLKTACTSALGKPARLLMHSMHSGRSVIRAVTIAVLCGTVPPRDAVRRRSGPPGLALHLSEHLHSFQYFSVIAD
jgi:hypothetical protein